MINILIFENGFEITGHSELATKGKDILCSAVSAVAQGIVNCFSKKDIDELKIEDGYLLFKIKNLNGRNKIVLEVFYNQIKTIESSYKKNIKIKFM